MPACAKAPKPVARSGVDGYIAELVKCRGYKDGSTAEAKKVLGAMLLGAAKVLGDACAQQVADAHAVGGAASANGKVLALAACSLEARCEKLCDARCPSGDTHASFPSARVLRKFLEDNKKGKKTIRTTADFKAGFPKKVQEVFFKLLDATIKVTRASGHKYIVPGDVDIARKTLGDEAVYFPGAIRHAANTSAKATVVLDAHEAEKAAKAAKGKKRRC